MTLTVQDKRTVKAECAWPKDMKATYSNTGSKGSVTSKDTATLTLSRLDGVEVEKVLVYVRSNKSAGAGVITMTADGKQLYRNEGTYMEWFGAYNNTDYQPIGWSGEQTASTLEVQVMGTTNSLHIEKYEITWTEAQAQAYSVTLMTDGVSEVVQETEVGSGILLPKRADKDGWFFAGWTSSELMEATDEQPEIWQAGERYYPKKDVTLWAVWTDVEPPTGERQAAPEDGYYVLELFDYLLTGDVNNGLMKLEEREPVDGGELYYLDFNTADTTCTIRNWASNAYVGYNETATELRQAESVWHYRVLPDTTWLFIAKEEGDKVWILYRKFEQEVVWLSDYTLGDHPKGAWCLYRVPDPEQTPMWWCHPNTEGVVLTNEGVNELTNERVIPWGPFELVIKNGRKVLRIRELGN